MPRLSQLTRAISCQSRAAIPTVSRLRLLKVENHMSVHKEKWARSEDEHGVFE